MGPQVASKRKISSATAWRSEAPNLPINAVNFQSGKSGKDALGSGQTQWPARAGMPQQSGQVMQVFLTN
jgi:hypothetical protein